MGKKVVVVGGDAAGMSAASQIKRQHPDWNVVVFEKGEYVSYAACGMPYYIEGIISHFNSLIEITADKFINERKIDLRLNHEVIKLDPLLQKVTVKNQDNIFEESFDFLVIATGASPLKGDFPINSNKVFTINAAPELNDLTVNSVKVPAYQLAVIGGGFINVYDTNGKPLSQTDLSDVSLTFTAKEKKFLGDLEQILNGFTEVSSTNFQLFADDAFQKIQSEIDKGKTKLYTLQYLNGKWEYIGDAIIKKYEKTKKADNGSIIKYNKYLLTTAPGVKFEKLAPFAFAMKVDFLKGTAKLCVKEGGYKMFDGTIVTSKASDNKTKFDWIDKPVSNATSIGDDNIINSKDFTGEDGCIEVSYKVPGISPKIEVAFQT